MSDEERDDDLEGTDPSLNRKDGSDEDPDGGFDADSGEEDTDDFQTGSEENY